MLNSQDETQLDPLAREFRAALRQRLPDVAVSEAFTDRLVITIPARHPETGPIVVWLDGDEITVGIGEYFHCHFETYLDEGVPPAERDSVAARSAVDFIENFMADAIVLRVCRENGQVVSAGTHAADIPEPLGPDQIEYLWSGPKT